MKLIRTTPVPNRVFDEHLYHLGMSELKVLLVIIRKTLGWKGEGNGRKQRDWISSEQLSRLTGVSKRAISGAISSLLSKKLIQVTGTGNRPLTSSSERRGQSRLYFELTKELTVENDLNTGENSCKNLQTSAKPSLNIRSKVNDLAQKLRITKETLQK